MTKNVLWFKSKQSDEKSVKLVTARLAFIDIATKISLTLVFYVLTIK